MHGPLNVKFRSRFPTTCRVSENSVINIQYLLSLVYPSLLRRTYRLTPSKTVHKWEDDSAFVWDAVSYAEIN